MKDRHDIANTLAVLIGNAHYLLEEELDPATKEVVGEIVAAAGRLRSLVLGGDDAIGSRIGR